MNKNKVKKIIEILYELYPDAKAELNYSSPLELLIATILSAQCTDVRVNIITKELFKHVQTPEDIIALGRERLSDIIKTCGMYRQKSKNIMLTARRLIDVYNSEVPETVDELITLAGVGRKTANVVVSNVFDTQAIAVDTHVLRLSNRIGLAKGDNPLDVEKQLMKVLPEPEWTQMHHSLIFHGRRVCKARKPDCAGCAISELCEKNNVKSN